MVPTPRGLRPPEDELQRGCPGSRRGCWSPQPSSHARPARFVSFTGWPPGPRMTELAMSTAPAQPAVHARGGADHPSGPRAAGRACSRSRLRSSCISAARSNRVESPGGWRARRRSGGRRARRDLVRQRRSALPEDRASRLVGRDGRAGQGARHGSLPHPRLRLARRRAAHDRARATARRFRPFSAYDQADLPAARCSTTSALPSLRGSSAHRTAAWWRWPSASDTRTGVARRDLQRRASHASHVDGLAQRAARDRALRASATARARRAWCWRARWPWPRTARREEFEERFAGAAGADGRKGSVFPVEQYLMSRGESYAARYRPEAFVCLSESIDLHRDRARAHPHCRSR